MPADEASGNADAEAVDDTDDGWSGELQSSVMEDTDDAAAAAVDSVKRGSVEFHEDLLHIKPYAKLSSCQC